MENKNNDKLLIGFLEELLSNLNFDVRQFTIERFITWLESIISWRIEVKYQELPESVDAFWTKDSRNQINYIFVNSKKSSLRQENGLLHELGHIVFGHETLEFDGVEDIQTLINCVAKRSKSYAQDPQQEHEAELFAWVVGARILSTGDFNPNASGFLDKL